MSEQPKNTPGPWATDHVFGDEDHDIVLDYDVEGQGRPIAIATVFLDDVDDPAPFITREQADANARLIAAAPELLAALREIGEAFDQINCGAARAIDFDCRALIAQARAAIAKAEGRR